MMDFHHDSTPIFRLWWRFLWLVSDRKVGPISISSICECKSFRKHMIKRMVSEQMFSSEVTIVSSIDFASIILRNVNVICKYLSNRFGRNEANSLMPFFTALMSCILEFNQLQNFCFCLLNDHKKLNQVDMA